jgi:hypothetical protein
VAAATERLEHVDVVVAPGAVPAPLARLDVMHLEPGRPGTALLASRFVSRERARTRVTPEVIVDEVRAARVAAPTPTPRGQRSPTPRAHLHDVRGGLTTFDEQAVDLGHPAHTSGTSAPRKNQYVPCSFRT